MPNAIAVSVIVPVFEDPAGLNACLQGLARQTVPGDRFEVVVVDNGSIPPLSLPDCGPPNVSLVRCMTPGSYAARNAGVRAACGPVLAFTDADCVPEAEWLEKGMGVMKQAGCEAIVGGDVLMSAAPGQSAVALYQSLVGFQQAENIRIKGFSATANLFCSRSAFERIGPFTETLFSGGDREWGWRAARHGIETMFAQAARVQTLPRTTLRGAIRQARRVAAGRHQLRQSGLASGRLESVEPHRGVFASLVWILSRDGIGWFDRLRVLAVASVIKAGSVLESLRLRFGGHPERR